MQQNAPWLDYQAPSGPAPIVTRQADPRLPAQTRQANNQADASAVDPARAAADLEAVRLQNQERARALALNGMTQEQRRALEGRNTSLNDFESNINELERVYQEDFQGSNGGILGFGGANNILGSLPNRIRPSNQRLENAANRLIGTIAQAQGITAQQSNTPGEMRLRFGGFLPTSTDTDQQIEEKIAALRGILQSQRAQVQQQLGAPPPGASPSAAPGTTAAPGEQADRTSLTAAPTADPNMMGLSHGDTQMDPAQQAINNQARHRLSQMMKRGVPDSEVAAYAQQQRMDPMSVARALMWRRGERVPGVRGTWQDWRRSQPNADYPIDFPAANRPMGALEGTISGAAASAPGVALANAGNAVIPTPLIASALGGDPERMRLGLAAGQAEHPYAALGGNIAGTALAYGAGGRAASGVGGAIDRFAPRTAEFLSQSSPWRSRVGDAVYGALQGTGENGDPLSGMAESIGGGMFGRSVARGAGHALRGAANLNVRALTGANVPLTIGQILRPSQNLAARFISSSEDRLAGLPLTGDIIGAARYRGHEGFNRAGFERGLRSVPGDVTTTGASGVGQAQNITGRAYRNALDGVNLVPDPQYHADIGSVRSTASAIPLHGDNINYTLDQAATLANPNLSGQNMQAAREMLRGERAALSGPNAPPLSAPARDAYTQAEGALTDLVDRQSPGTMPDLINADRAYRNTSILGDAVGSARARPDELFTPAQLGTADFNNTVKFGGRNAARAGRTPFYALRRSGSEVMGNMIPDSGTAGRSMLYGLGGMTLAGGGAGGAAGYNSSGDAGGAISGAGSGVEDALALSALLFAPHSRAGQHAIQTLLVRRPQALRRAGAALLDSPAPRLGGMFGASALSYGSGRD